MPAASLQIASYDPEWVRAFELERDRIAAALGPLARRIDHHGSTAVPGLAAKPVVDIQISVAPLRPIEPYVHALVPLGYVHVPDSGDAVCPFLHRPHEWPHTHHVHLVEAGGLEERRTLAFRDFLRDHADARLEYEQLKRRLAAAHSAGDRVSREAYADAKSTFVERIVRAALAVGYPRGVPPLRELVTPRLRLRRWRASDREPFAAMNADAPVMAHFPSVLSREESDALAAAIQRHFDEHGFGVWAVEVPGVTPFAGFVGLAIPRFEAHFMPAVEIGWRLAVPYWGAGYATEGARAALAFGFDSLGLREIVSFTTDGNLRSRRVMERLGMTHDPRDDFDHPALEVGHPLRRHVLYRIMSPA